MPSHKLSAYLEFNHINFLEMKISILPLLATTSLAFNVVPEPRTTTHLSLKNEDVALPFPFVDGPFEDIDPDMDRAKDCADHIGKCSLKEIAKLKEGRSCCLLASR